MSRIARMKRMPSQKDGVARPAIEIVRMTRSIGLFCFSAEIVPSGIAIRLATTTAKMQISSEIGKRAAISVKTGLPDHIDMPKSPRKNPHTKSTNCRNIEWSRPSCAWQAATARSSKVPPPEPRRTTQISPGMRRISRNTSAAAPSKVGTTSSTRFMMYRYIVSSSDASLATPFSNAGLAAFAHHRVAERADPGDLDIDRVAVLDVLRRAFGAHPDDVARVKRQVLRHPADEGRGPEDHAVGLNADLFATVYPHDRLRRVEVEIGFDPGPHRLEGVGVL